MSRRPDPARKPQLLDDIMEYLLDRSLTSVTFRTLADHLGVSTFTLVYHFGTKTELIAEVVGAVCSRQRDAFADAHASTTSLDDYFDSMRSYWRWTLIPSNRKLQRIAFEAAMMEALDSEAQTTMKMTLRGWHDIAVDGMRDLGVPDEIVADEARAMANIVYGLQYDLVLLSDVERADAAFEAVLATYRARVRDLVDASARSEA